MYKTRQLWQDAHASHHARNNGDKLMAEIITGSAAFALCWTDSLEANNHTAPDITPLARLLAPGDRLKLVFHGQKEQPQTQRLTVEMQTTQNSETDAARLRTAIAAALPEFTITANISAPHPLPARTRLRAMHRPFLLVPDTRREQSPPKGGAEFRLPAQGKFDIARTLAGLSNAVHCYALEITLIAANPSVSDHLLLGKATRQLRPPYKAFFEDLIGTRQSVEDLALLEAWMLNGGWKLQVDLGLPAADPALAAMATNLLFDLPAAPPTDTASALDLSYAIPFNQRLPALLPDYAAMARLGFAGPKALTGVPKHLGPRLHIGTTASGATFAIPRSDLARHCLVLGATGTGKSTLLKQMIRQDIADGISTIVIDPHGDLFADTLAALPAPARQHSIFADASGQHGPFGLDLFANGAASPAMQANFVANQMISIFTRVLYTQVGEAFGPMFEAYFRNAIMLLMLSGDPQDAPRSLMDFQQVFHDADFRRKCLETCTDDQVVQFWRYTAVKAGGEAALENIAPYIVSKLTQFIGNPLIRNIISGSIPPIDFATSLDSGHCMLFNLAKGTIGEKDAALLGALVTIKLFGTLLQRCARPQTERPRVRIYMDEFQTFATDALGQMLSEARKTGAELVLASQDLTSFGGSGYRPEVAGAILSNVGNLMCFRTGPQDARLLSDWFAPHISQSDLMSLPDRVLAARTLAGGTPRPPQIIRLTQEEAP